MNKEEMQYLVDLHGKCNVSEARRKSIESRITNQFTVLWEYAHKAGHDSKVPVRCNVDGDIVLRWTSRLDSDMLCDVCLDNKYRKIAEAHNFEYMITRRSYSSFVILRCKHDGNFITVRIGNLLNQRKLYCSVCKENATMSALESKACSYIRAYTIKGFIQVDYLNTDGRLFTKSDANICKGCFAVDDSHWDQAHSLYVIQLKYDGAYYYKIGTANNPENRLKSLRLLGESSVTTVMRFDTRHEADVEEKRLHKLYNNYRLTQEIPSTFTKGKSKHRTSDGLSFKLSGCTEWFSSEVCDKLNSRFKLNLVEK